MYVNVGNQLFHSVYLCMCLGERRKQGERQKEMISKILVFTYIYHTHLLLRILLVGMNGCEHICVHMSRCVCTCVHVYWCKSLMLEFFLYSSPPYLLRQGLSLNLKFLGIVVLDGQQTLGILYLLPSVGNTGTCCCV